MGLCLPQNLTNPPFLLLKATASTAIINFAPSLLVSEHSGGSGLSGRDAVLLSTSIAVAKAVGMLAGLLLVDRVGRRPLLIGGAAGCTASMAALTLAGWATASSTGNGSDGGGGSSGTVFLLTGLCAFILSFSVSWAGLYWVLVSELFSMGAKSAASSAATSMLFLTGE